MVELKDTFGGTGQIEYAEHSRKSGAKKVVAGVSAFPSQPGTTPEDIRTINPIQGAVGGVSASLTLLRNKGYRVVASVACYIRLSLGASAAAVGDIYLPADSPINLSTKSFDTLSFIQVTGGGIIQAVEVE